MTDAQISVQQMKELILAFCEVRNWRTNSHPKDLAISISLEANELLEHFQWGISHTPEMIKKDKIELSRITHELADIFVYAILFADRLDIDLTTAIRNKLHLNEKKYPEKLFKAKKVSLKQYKKIKQVFRAKERSLNREL